MSIFFMAGAVVSLTAAISLAFPGSFLEPMWRLNPAAREAFAGLEAWAVLPLLVVCPATAATALGLWPGHRWGRKLAIDLFLVSVAADIGRAVIAGHARALIGVPIATIIAVYLMANRIRRYFELCHSMHGNLRGSNS